MQRHGRDVGDHGDGRGGADRRALVRACRSGLAARARQCGGARVVRSAAQGPARARAKVAPRSGGPPRRQERRRPPRPGRRRRGRAERPGAGSERVVGGRPPQPRPGPRGRRPVAAGGEGRVGPVGHRAWSWRLPWTAATAGLRPGPGGPAAGSTTSTSPRAGRRGGRAGRAAPRPPRRRTSRPAVLPVRGHAVEAEPAGGLDLRDAVEARSRSRRAAPRARSPGAGRPGGRAGPGSPSRRVRQERPWGPGPRPRSIRSRIQAAAAPRGGRRGRPARPAARSGAPVVEAGVAAQGEAPVAGAVASALPGGGEAGRAARPRGRSRSACRRRRPAPARRGASVPVARAEGRARASPSRRTPPRGRAWQGNARSPPARPPARRRPERPRRLSRESRRRSGGPGRRRRVTGRPAGTGGPPVAARRGPWRGPGRR